MKNNSWPKIFPVVFLTFAIFSATLFSQSPERFFDTAALSHQEIRLVVFYPSVGTIKNLLGLLNQAFVPVDKMEVIGVYHEKERTNYQEAIKFAQENNLAWLKFHPISAEIDENSIFQKNSCSEEFENIFKKSDGMIFFGGPDIPPHAYKSKTSLLTRIEDPDRHYLELSFIFHLLGGSQDENFKGLLESRPYYPILGICLGSQSLNVGSGGTLIQDVWSEVYGKNYIEDIIELGQENWHANPLARLHPEEKKLLTYMMHPILLEENGKFCTELGFKKSDKPYMISSHHQAAGRLGKGFQVAATTLDDKVIEAIEHEKFPNVLGIQFHPEFTILWETEAKYKFAPQDKELIGLKTFLDNHPPSFEFHKKIWAWLYEKLIESHNQNASK